jgi:hypothetical protein
MLMPPFFCGPICPRLSCFFFSSPSESLTFLPQSSIFII